MSCGYVLCTVLLSVAVLLAVTVTGAILFMNHYHTPGTESPPVISTNPEEANALVTIEKADSSRINIFIDPNCPSAAGTLGRLEGLQSSLLSAVTDHDAEAKATKSQQKALLVTVADEVAKLLSHAVQLRADCDSLKKGHSAMGQELSALQGEQGRLIQVSSSLGMELPVPNVPGGTAGRSPWSQQPGAEVEGGFWGIGSREVSPCQTSASEPGVQPPTLGSPSSRCSLAAPARAKHSTEPSQGQFMQRSAPPSLQSPNLPGSELC